MKNYSYPYDINDDAFIQTILSNHQIKTDADWNDMVHAFMLGNFAAPHSLSIADLHLPANVNTSLMRIWFDPSDNSNHTIQWQLVNWDGTTKPTDITDGVCYFSAVFLQAIDNKFHPDHLEFYKLKEIKGTGITAAGFNVVDSHGGILYHGDITSQFPFQGDEPIAHLP
jgi:hypothetical protein